MSHGLRYFISIEDLAQARGAIPELAFHGDSPEFLARAVQAALREPDLWQRWRAMQEDPEAVDAATGRTDPGAEASASLKAQRVELIVRTTLPHALLKHRLDLLLGQHWQLHDIS